VNIPSAENAPSPQNAPSPVSKLPKPSRQRSKWGQQEQKPQKPSSGGHLQIGKAPGLCDSLNDPILSLLRNSINRKQAQNVPQPK
jgi:hypothetical protein